MHTMECMCVCAKLLQSCLIPCDPMDCSLPDSSVCGIFQARILEWVEIPFLSFPSPGDLPNPEIKPVSPALLADSLPLSHLTSIRAL